MTKWYAGERPTFQEACDSGLPFVTQPKDGRKIFEYWQGIGGSMGFFGENGCGYEWSGPSRTTTTTNSSYYNVIDWFEIDPESPATVVNSARTQTKCTCDFYSVILRTGCVCGGE